MQRNILSIHHLHYVLSNKRVIFDDLSLSLPAMKTGLVGRNGSGKSTLLKLITGELAPDSGSIEIAGKVAYLPQNYSLQKEASVAEILGVKFQLAAMQRILQGSTAENDFAIFNEDWSLPERIQQKLASFNLAHIELDRLIKSLSGGEATRLLLLKVFLTNADILLFDEPTNNLDASARNLFYQQIENWKGTVLIATHDRELLNKMEQIIELTTLGAKIYGGNFQLYIEQKKLETDAKQRQLQDAKKFLINTETSIQHSREKHDQRRAQGRKLRITGKIDKLSANAAQGRSERTQRRLATFKEQMLEEAQQRLQQAKEKVEISEVIKINLPETYVPNDKLILSIEKLSFAYPHQKLLINNFNLTLHGPKRIAFAGDNGSGKTTLIKLILGELAPLSGKIELGTTRINYLDQHASLLFSKQTLLENFLRFNPAAKEQEARYALAQFLFKDQDALKQVEQLSGGEKLRALLACVLLSSQPPQLLILDEPTNHLDLSSIASIETALNCYQGALIVISHDQTFLQNIGVEQTYILSRVQLNV